MNQLFFYTYMSALDDGTPCMAFSFIIAPDVETAITFLPVDPTTGLSPPLSNIGGITCDGPARIVAGIPIGTMVKPF